MGFLGWWKRSSNRSLNQVTNTSSPSLSPQSLPLSTSKSVQTLRSIAPSTTFTPAYAASSYSITCHSPTTPYLHRHGSFRRFSLASRASNDHGQLQTPPSPLISQDPPTHVDLLDAQGQFRPSDFHARLKASGTRDYGEDVAERNLGQNGVELFSPAVKAFYANLPKDALRSRKFNYPISILEDPEEPSAPVTRTRSLSSSTQNRRVESTRPLSRNSVCSTPAHRQATLQNFRNSSQSIGRPTLQANSRLSIDTRERSASPPAISRYRSGTPTSTIAHSETNQPTPLALIQSSEELGIHDISLWHPVPSDTAQRRASNTSSPTNSSNYETADSTIADSIPAVCIPDTTCTLETLAELSDYTTEGEDIEAYLQKCKRRTSPDGEALVFKEEGFGGEGHGALPGLFDDLPEPEPEVPENIPGSDEEPSSVEESIPTPTLSPSLFHSQRERLLALGFDYDSEEDHVRQDEQQDHDLCTAKVMHEIPSTVVVDMAAVKAALERRKQTKRQQLRTLKHNRRARQRWGIEDDGNDADVE